MDESYPPSWAGPGAAVGELLGFPGVEAPAPRHGPHNPKEFAQRLFAFEALQPPAPRQPIEEQPEPFSLQWFLNIENHRHGRHARWIPKLLEFAKHSGERLLGLGHGLGTDWVQYAAHGACVIVCSTSPAQLELVRRNFELRGLSGGFIHAPAARLPFDANSIDVVCVSSLFHGIEQPEGVVQEVYRVLKPGGKVLAVAPARFDVEFWRTLFFFGCRWFTGKTAGPKPEERYSGWALRRLFHRFAEHRIHKRQLRRSEVPHLWRGLPLPLLARIMGRVLVLKAFKPLSAAIR